MKKKTPVKDLVAREIRITFEMDNLKAERQVTVSWSKSVEAELAAVYAVNIKEELFRVVVKNMLAGLAGENWLRRHGAKVETSD